MYKIATDLSQRRLRQLWLKDLQSDGFLSLTPEEQRDSLRARVKSVDQELLAQPKNDYRAELGQIKHELQMAINAIRPKRKGPPETAHFFVQVVQKNVPKFQYIKWMNEATEMARDAALSAREGG